LSHVFHRGQLVELKRQDRINGFLTDDLIVVLPDDPLLKIGKGVSRILVHPKTGSAYLEFEHIALKMLQGEVTGRIDARLKIGGIDIFVLIDLSVNVPGFLDFPSFFQVGVFKFIKTLAGTGREEHSEEECTHTYNGSSYQVRS